MFFDEVFEHRKEAEAVLSKVKKERGHLKTRVVRVGSNTWIEREVEESETMERTGRTVSTQEAETAVRAYKEFREKVRQTGKQMESSRKVIEEFGQENRDKFTDDRLELAAGTIIRREGKARALRGGTELTPEQVEEFLELMPREFVKKVCDFDLLYEHPDGAVTDILNERDISLIRDEFYDVR